MAPMLFVLPWLNYTLDPWRVMHHDYTQSYNRISINKNFLKVSYLIKNPKKYDTLLMGSSRNAALNASLISDNGYNMSFEFGVVGAHLHNLTTLLNKHVHIKNLWIGINDYAIWKDPNAHKVDYAIKSYPNSFLENLKFYQLYLLKKIDSKDISIMTGETVLEESNRILRANLTKHFNGMKKREENLAKKADLWKKEISQLGGERLGYTDTTYRIDKTIKEISQIKDLCETYDINLTLFVYPAFYKTYLIYNQYKIETFKRKLAAVTPFYDFYDLNDISFNELKWTDNSHFTLSIGNFIIKNIQENNFLVNKTTIDKHISDTRNSIKNLLNKVLPIPYILPITSHIDLSTLHTLFNFADGQYTHNDQLKITQKKHYSQLNATGNDPLVVLPKIHTQSENTILHLDIESPQNTVFQIFFKNKENTAYTQSNSSARYIKKGRTQINVLIPSSYLNKGLRIDPVSKAGTYKIHSLILYD